MVRTRRQQEFLSELPDELLELCFAACGNSLRHHANSRLVCKRWRRIIDSSSRLVGELRLTKATRCAVPAALVSLSRRIAAATHVAHIDAAARCLPAAFSALQHLTALSVLTLICNDGGGPRHSMGKEVARQPGGLTALAGLRHLLLCVDDLQPRTCSQLSALTTLTYLSVEVIMQQVPLAFWRAVAHLRQLAELGIAVHTVAGKPCAIGDKAWEALQECTQLTALSLGHRKTIAHEDRLRGRFHLTPGLASLTSLRTLLLDGTTADMGDLWQHPTLTNLHLVNWRIDDPPMPPPPLALPPGQAGPRDGAGAEAGPPTMPSLRHVALLQDVGELPPSLGPFLPAFSGITSLHLLGLDSADSLVWDDLRQLPHLASLSVAGCDFDSDFLVTVLPQGIRNLTTLRALDLSSTSINMLPAGPYLDNLRTLLLAGHCLRRLPLTLMDAHQLEVLDLSACEQHKSELSMPPEEVGLFKHMSSLRLLCAPCSTAHEENCNAPLLLLLAAAMPNLWVLMDGSVDSLEDLFPDDWNGGMDVAVWRQHHAAQEHRLLAWMRQNAATKAGSGLRKVYDESRAQVQQ